MKEQKEEKPKKKNSVKPLRIDLDDVLYMEEFYQIPRQDEMKLMTEITGIRL